MLEMETENGGAKEQNFFDVEAETKKKNLNINDFAVQFWTLKLLNLGQYLTSFSFHLFWNDVWTLIFQCDALVSTKNVRIFFFPLLQKTYEQIGCFMFAIPNGLKS